MKNVGEGAIHCILEARDEGGAFCTLNDFARRVDLRKVNKKVFESLIKCGAFDGQGHTRRALSESLDLVLDDAASFQKDKASGQVNLFDTECMPAGDAFGDTIPELSEWEDLEKLSFEKEMIGFYITGHPLMRYEEEIRRYTSASSVTLGALPENSGVRLAGLVKSSKEITTKKGDRMAFVTLEDLTGTIEVTVFSDLYAQVRDLLQSGDPLIVVGVREGDEDNPKVLAKEIHHIEEAQHRYSNAVHIHISAPGTDLSQISNLKHILQRHKGRIPITLHVTIPKRTETIIGLPAFKCEPSTAFIAEIKEALGGNQTVTLE